MALASGLPVGIDLKGLQQKAGIGVLGGLVFRVEAGTHAGATVTSSRATLTVGAALDNDVVLIGDNLAQHHGRLGLADSWPPRVRLEALDGPVEIPGGRMLQQGHVIDLPLPLSFRMGTAECSVSGRREPASLMRKSAPLAALVLALLIVPPVLSGLFSGVSGLFSSSPVPGPAVTTTNGSSPTDPAATQRWQEQLTNRLRMAGLAGQVSIERGGGGNIVAVGEVDETATEKWRDVLKWYDAQGSGPLLVNNVVRTGGQTALPGIRTVWLDANPQVVLANGQSAGVGETITGGWKIEAIERAGIVLSREGRTARITF